MLRYLSTLIDLFRLPVIEEIENDYIGGADSALEKRARRKAVARGLFRRGTFDM